MSIRVRDRDWGARPLCELCRNTRKRVRHDVRPNTSVVTEDANGSSWQYVVLCESCRSSVVEVLTEVQPGDESITWVRNLEGGDQMAVKVVRMTEVVDCDGCADREAVRRAEWAVKIGASGEPQTRFRLCDECRVAMAVLLAANGPGQ